MRWKNILTVYAKELRDMLRDRRTIMSMVIVPTLLMPGITIAAISVSARVAAKARAEVPKVIVLGGEDSPRFRAAVAGSDKIKIVSAPQDWRQSIVDKAAQAVIEIPAGFDAALANEKPVDLRIYDYLHEMRSEHAASLVRELAEHYRDEVVNARLTQHGLARALIRPFEVKTENVAPPERVGGNLFGGMVPYFFLLLSFTGAMYPAMDLTAGEKERGTMETILCSPVGRTELVLGKFLMVLTASLATVLCSLVSTAVTLVILGSLLGLHSAAPANGASAVMSSFAINPVGLLFVVLMIVPMAVLFAAIQFSLALFAKSFKEAQSYVSPLIIVIILPAVIGMLPGVELNGKLALVPILNVSLVSKELVSGVWHWQWIGLIFGSTCVYAACALALAVRLFNREDVIFRA